MKIQAATTLVLTLLLASPAHAEYSLICGNVLDQGPSQSEVALVQDPDSLDMKFYLGGKELPEDRFIANGGTENRWNVTVYNEKGDVEASYELSEKPAQSQRYKIGKSREKDGAALKCRLTDTTPAPSPVQ